VGAAGRRGLQFGATGGWVEGVEAAIGRALRGKTGACALPLLGFGHRGGALPEACCILPLLCFGGRGAAAPQGLDIRALADLWPLPKVLPSSGLRGWLCAAMRSNCEHGYVYMCMCVHVCVCVCVWLLVEHWWS
jgi:hypothetical protein